MTGLRRLSACWWPLEANRKARVAVCALAALAALMSPRPTEGQSQGTEPGIEGSWLITVTIVGGPPPFRSLETFGAGGAFVASSSDSPGAVSPSHGTWTLKERRQFVVTFLAFQYDANGGHSGYIRVRETRRLLSRGNTISGTGTVEVLDTAFNVLFSADVTTEGTRIVP